MTSSRPFFGDNFIFSSLFLLLCCQGLNPVHARWMAYHWVTTPLLIFRSLETLAGEMAMAAEIPTSPSYSSTSLRGGEGHFLSSQVSERLFFHWFEWDPVAFLQPVFLSTEMERANRSSLGIWAWLDSLQALAALLFPHTGHLSHQALLGPSSSSTPQSHLFQILHCQPCFIFRSSLKQKMLLYLFESFCLWGPCRVLCVLMSTWQRQGNVLCTRPAPVHLPLIYK